MCRSTWLDTQGWCVEKAREAITEATATFEIAENKVPPPGTSVPAALHL